MKKILVLPGGGEKGYIQLSILAQMEKMFGPLDKYFDLVVGTSVGAINGSIVASGKIICQEFLPTFVSLCKRTFRKNYFTRTPLVRPIYSRDYISSELEYRFGKLKMSEMSTKYMATSLSWIDKRTHFFKSWEHTDGLEMVKDVVIRSFAAPYYFGKVVDQTNSQVWGDGGVGGNNTPLDYAYIETVRQQWTDPIEFYLVGTGYSIESESYKNARDMGVLSEILRYMDFGDGGLARYQSHFQQIQKMKILTESNPNLTFFNLDCELPEKLNKMDHYELVDYDPYIQKIMEELKKTIDSKIIPRYT